MTAYSIPTLETDRLILRAPKLSDLPALTDFFATERSHNVGGPRDEHDVARSMKSTFGSWALLGHGLFYIADKTTDAFLGWTGILYAPGWEEPELGWTVMPEAEGKGIAFEAAQAARNHAAHDLSIDAVISYIAPDNTRSQALAKRLGATYERNSTLLGRDVQVWRHPKLAEAA